MNPARDDRSAPRGAVKNKHAVLHFASTHDTIMAERLAAQRGYAAEVIPRPPGKIGRCGVALKVAAADLDALTGIFAKQGLADFDVAEG
jgi:hypothetical protein